MARCAYRKPELYRNPKLYRKPELYRKPGLYEKADGPVCPQVYDWMVQNIPYFKDKGDSNSSAGWKVRQTHLLTYVTSAPAFFSYIKGRYHKILEHGFFLVPQEVL